MGFRFVDAIATVGADSATTENLRGVVEKLSITTSWNDQFSGTATYVGGSASNVAMFEEAVVNFSK